MSMDIHVLNQSESFFEDSHPIGVLKQFREIYGNDMELNFSRYEYNPQTRLDIRERFKVNISSVNKEWFIDQMLRLNPQQELALESGVTLGGLKRHIPMLDFNGMAKDQLKAVMDVFPPELMNKILVYYSGRSFHAYFLTLLKKSEWVKFMGSALLCNLPHKDSAVDQRWVGHRLIGGYAALRWSHNTNKYRSMPTKFDTLILNESYKNKIYLSKQALEFNHAAFKQGGLYEQMVGNVFSSKLALDIDGVAKEFKGDCPTDFVFELNMELILVEAMFTSKADYLNSTHLKRLAERVSLYKENVLRQREYRDVRLILFTNTEIKDSDKSRLRKWLDIKIFFIEQTLTKDDVVEKVWLIKQFLNDSQFNKAPRV